MVEILNDSVLKEEILEDLTKKIKISTEEYERAPGLANIL